MPKHAQANADHLTSGANAEAYALQWLGRQGLKLVERNFRCRLGEIDLIMLDGDVLAIVEVRYRASHNFGHAAETVNRRKQARIIAATQFFLNGRPQHAERVVRFDIVALHGDGEPQWLQDAFQAF